MLSSRKLFLRPQRKYCSVRTSGATTNHYANIALSKSSELLPTHCRWDNKHHQSHIQYHTNRFDFSSHQRAQNRSFSSSTGGGGGGGPPRWGGSNGNNGSSSGNNGSMLPPWMHPQSNQPGHYLQQYTVDLTQMASKNQLDPIIGRQEEIRRCLQILARRTKCNPLLIGEAGVGKTAIAEGLAQRIQSGQVPDSMKNKRVLLLDVSSITAGAGIRGQLEERLKGVIRDVQNENGNIILFIDEIHTIMNIGKGGGGGGDGVDMANMIKPALARGELQLLGATTLQEYRMIEKDPALTRRFQTVYVTEPNINDTISILRGLKTSYELHHSIRIKDEAIIAAVTLSDRYITERKQPDKSIDLIDEACSKLRLELESKPEQIWQIERDLLTKQIELSALDNEENPNTKVIQRRDDCRKEVEELKVQVQQLTDIWNEEKTVLQNVQKKKEELEKSKQEMEYAKASGNYNRAAELLHGTIPLLESELAHLVAAVDSNSNNSNASSTSTKMLADSVTADVVTSIVSRHTGIPISRMNHLNNVNNTTGTTNDEYNKLLHIEDTLRQRVIGQDHVLTSIANCVRLARTNLQVSLASGNSAGRTMGNFLFLGPTGVGKTETVKALAEYLFDTSTAMTRIDMSEYSEQHTISRLLGAPPGYIGYDDAGILSESVRRRPYQIILFDEFEKAHSSIWNILLQIFDEGHLTDSHGRKVDFRNTIIIMTSNLGASMISELPEHIRGSEPMVHDRIMEIVRQHLSPELINRIDETIVFNRLQRTDMDSITDMNLRNLAKQLENNHNMTLQVSNNAAVILSEMGYDIRYGARPLRRVLARTVLNPLSRLILEGAIRPNDTVRIQTRAEADIEVKNDDNYEKVHSGIGWICSNDFSNDKNDIVIMRNHKGWDTGSTEYTDNSTFTSSEEYFLDDGNRTGSNH